MPKAEGSRSIRKHRDPDIAMLASRLLFSLQDELFARLAAEGHPDIRPRHGAVLAYLDHEGTRLTDLATMSGRHKQNVGVLVDELEALGYVARAPDPSDRRAKLVVPTALGTDQLERSDAIMREIEGRYDRLMPADFSVFRTLLGEMVNLQEKRTAPE